MRKSEFLDLSITDQESWIEESFPDYQSKAYEGTCFGLIYEVSDQEVKEYVEYPDDYDTRNILLHCLPEITEERLNAIEAGSSLTDLEKLSLKRHIAESDPDGWTGLHGWHIQCDDGSVFAVFYGHPQGQGGVQLEYVGAFHNKEQAESWKNSFEIHSPINLETAILREFLLS